MSGHERTFRRADGELIYGEYSFVTEPDLFDDAEEPTEVIEEEWILIRHRTRILGPHGLCTACQGEGVLTSWDNATRTLGPETTCQRCNGSCQEPDRDPDPPWTYTVGGRA